jgi:WD40 repeat protein
MSSTSRLNAKVTNTKLPWETEGAKFMEVGSIEAWQTEEGSSKFIRKWSKGYPKEVICVSYDPASKRIAVGLEDGVIDIIVMTENGYEDVVCVKAHKDKVLGVSYDSLSNCVYSASKDKIFRVSHGSSLALIVGIPHKEELMCMHRDIQNKRVFVGTKNGEVHIYDISQV